MTRAPDYNLLPQTLRSAELRNGNLIRCGPGVRGVGWPETPQMRAQALTGLFDTADLAGVLLTAAWVWGAAETPASEYTFSTFDGSRYLRAYTPRVRVHEFRLRPAHTVVLGGCAITTRMRTIYDLLYLDDASYEQFGLTAARQLIEDSAEPVRALDEQFHVSRRPHSGRAAERLSELLEIIR